MLKGNYGTRMVLRSRPPGTNRNIGCTIVLVGDLDGKGMPDGVYCIERMWYGFKKLRHVGNG